MGQRRSWQDGMPRPTDRANEDGAGAPSRAATWPHPGVADTAAHVHPADRIRRPIRIARSALTRCADAVAASVRVPALDKVALRRKPIVEQMEAVLQQDLLENWFTRVVDEQAGGYRECFDRAWRLLDDTRRSLIYQCRIVWAAAAFAQYAPEHARSFGAHALHGVDFLERRLRDPEHGSFFFSIDKHGKPFREDEKHALTSAYTMMNPRRRSP